MNFFDTVFYEPCLNIFYGIYLITKDVGLAIVSMALLIRLVMWPFIQKSYITGQKTRLVQPLIKKIQQQYKGDIVGLQAKLKELYAKYDIKTSLAGLIVLLQLPIYYALYHLIKLVNEGSYLNGLYSSVYSQNQEKINRLAFGFININDAVNNGNSATVFVLALATMFFSFLMSRYIFQQPIVAPSAEVKKEVNSNSEKPKEDPLIDPEIFNKTLRFQMTYLMPVLSFALNISLPAGLNIYFLAGTIFSLTQQIILVKKYQIKQEPIQSDPEIISDNPEVSKITEEKDSENQIQKLKNLSKDKKIKKSKKIA